MDTTFPSASTSKNCACGLGQASWSCPTPAYVLAMPLRPGWVWCIVTERTSPGIAPSTFIGPVEGLTSSLSNDINAASSGDR